MPDNVVYIKAHVIRAQGDVLTVRLMDGFAQAEAVVYAGNAMAAIPR